MSRTYDWEFPLPRTHTGMLQGNATFGAMIWGEGAVLRVTIGRADFWDHRGGLPWTEKQSYANIRDCLQRGDDRGLRALFEDTGPKAGEPHRPSILPIGRFDIDFGAGARLLRGTLDLDDGTAYVRVRKGKRSFILRIALDMGSPRMVLALPSGLVPREVRCVPAWEHVGDHLRSISFQPPALFDEGPLCGWIQTRPVDTPLAAAAFRTKREIWLSAVCGETQAVARASAESYLRDGARRGPTKLLAANRRWWRTYWRDVPAVEMPNEKLRFLYDYGMYKFAGLTQPAGVAATLQGAWIEEYQMPPWSSDYHFNINVQMCYWPAYHGNRLEHLRPMFDLIRGWLPVLRHNAKVFLGIDDGLMLPHAVDDRCVCMGGFWTGSIDHGCTAWVAQMMYRYYRYTLDKQFLADTAYPFMVGTMRVYEAMIERDGDSLALPVSVSPEYRGASMNAWGRNASFQLACVHRLCEDLLDASEALGRTPAPQWGEIRAKLPRASLIGPQGHEQIALWDGTPLEESHRHHSHLSGITPFDVLDFDDAPTRALIERSIAHWIKMGPGLWSGWCVPWASMLHTRMGNADAAELWLEIWERLFTNEGHGTLHDVHFSGFSLMGKGASCSGPMRGEIMQIEAGMSAVTAIQEMLLHVRRGVTRLFAGAPSRWRDVSFRHMRTDGAFLVSAHRAGGTIGPVTIRSLAGGVFRMENPWSAEAIVCRGRRTQRLAGAILDVRMARGETVSVRSAPMPR